MLADSDMNPTSLVEYASAFYLVICVARFAFCNTVDILYQSEPNRRPSPFERNEI